MSPADINGIIMESFFYNLIICTSHYFVYVCISFSFFIVSMYSYVLKQHLCRSSNFVDLNLSATQHSSIQIPGFRNILSDVMNPSAT